MRRTTGAPNLCGNPGCAAATTIRGGKRCVRGPVTGKRKVAVYSGLRGIRVCERPKKQAKDGRSEPTAPTRGEDSMMQRKFRRARVAAAVGAAGLSLAAAQVHGAGFALQE